MKIEYLKIFFLKKILIYNNNEKMFNYKDDLLGDSV